jgi:hypothetical protein
VLVASVAACAKRATAARPTPNKIAEVVLLTAVKGVLGLMVAGQATRRLGPFLRLARFAGLWRPLVGLDAQLRTAGSSVPGRDRLAVDGPELVGGV